MGIPFCKNGGFPKLSAATSQIGNSLFKTSVIIGEGCSSERPLEMFFRVLFPFVIIAYTIDSVID